MSAEMTMEVKDLVTMAVDKFINIKNYEVIRAHACMCMTVAALVLKPPPAGGSTIGQELLG
jgi:hypothetical protein